MNNQIRKDITKNNRNPFNNWVASTMQSDEDINRETKKQEDLIGNWKRISQSGDRARISEAELARRISASTEGDNATARNEQRVKDFKIGNIVADKMKKNQGQTEEDFQEELNAWGNKYKKAIGEAIKEVQHG